MELLNSSPTRRDRILSEQTETEGEIWIIHSHIVQTWWHVVICAINLIHEVPIWYE